MSAPVERVGYLHIDEAADKRLIPVEVNDYILYALSGETAVPGPARTLAQHSHVLPM